MLDPHFPVSNGVDDSSGIAVVRSMLAIDFKIVQGFLFVAQGKISHAKRVGGIRNADGKRFFEERKRFFWLARFSQEHSVQVVSPRVRGRDRKQLLENSGSLFSRSGNIKIVPNTVQETGARKQSCVCGGLAY